MKLKSLAVTLTAVLLIACGQPAETPQTAEQTAEQTDRNTMATAERIAQQHLIVDTHIDVPYRLELKQADISVTTEGGDFDYPRALAGGLNAPFMSIYTKAALEAEGGSKDAADNLIEMVEGFVQQSPDKFAIPMSVADLRAQVAAGLMSLPMGMENGSPLEGNLDNLQGYYDVGIRYITLTHSLSNHISDSSYDDNKQWQGLSNFGRDVVREMNRLGIMVDVSHISDDAFWQVMKITTVPAIASHSSARHFTPGFERNMSDEMITALADNGGVIQINFGSSFVTQAARDYSDALSAARKAYSADHPDLSSSELRETFTTIYQAEHGQIPFATTDEVLDHFDHVVAIAGIDHVGIGSDYDGVGDSLPIGLKDVASYPNLINGLLQRGYSEADIRKILGENLLRVWQANEDYAAQAATTSSST